MVAVAAALGVALALGDGVAVDVGVGVGPVLGNCLLVMLPIRGKSACPDGVVCGGALSRP